MNITYIPNRSITLVTSDFRVLTGSKSTCDWAAVEAAVKANDEQALINAISVKKAIENFDSTGNIEVRGSDVFYRGIRLFGEDVKRIVDYIVGGAPKVSMMKFLDSKLRNPSPASVASLYSFLNNKEMPLTANGTILGFKGVRFDLYSVHTGAEPLISGIRREDGAICNEIGQTVWMKRNFVDANPDNSCGAGLHIGSRNYAKGWGPRVMIVEFAAEDVVVVPNCASEVLRVNAYKIVGELNTQDYLGETFNDNYARPSETPEPPEITDEREECLYDEETSVPTPVMIRKPVYSISQWSKGQAAGFADGKAHQKRKFYECDVNTTFKKFSKEFVVGYNIGYRDGRATNS